MTPRKLRQWYATDSSCNISFT